MPKRLSYTELADYKFQHPDCEVWAIMPLHLRAIVVPSRAWDRRLEAHDIAHVCRGPGREHFLANILHVNRTVHVWCDQHGRAGQVLLFFAKWKSSGVHWQLWGRLFSAANSIRGYLEEDKTSEQCREWGIDELRQLMLADEDVR